MRVLDPGHRYALDNLKDPGAQVLQFYKDPELHDGLGEVGTNCQEVLRAVIDRVKKLDAEKPHMLNNFVIIPGLRRALAGFEARALLLKAEKGVALEDVVAVSDGHFSLAFKR